ncbi:MAG: tetratricopeptide repeat protein [Chlorobiaceae bacterium]|nr:tetratricopeptide repeat protein [Chlorobiaceae bacterium]
MNDTPSPETGAPGSDYRQALVFIGEGRMAQAIEILDALAGPASRDARIRYARAVALLSNGEYQKAGTDLVFAVALDPAFMPAYRHLGFVLLTMGKELAAIKVLKAAIAIDRGFVDAWCVLGDVYLDLGEAEKALDAFETALSLEPGNPEPHCKLAMYHLSKGDMHGLRREYEVLRELDPCMAGQIAELLP